MKIPLVEFPTLAGTIVGIQSQTNSVHGVRYQIHERSEDSSLLTPRSNEQDLPSSGKTEFSMTGKLDLSDGSPNTGFGDEDIPSIGM